MTRRLVFGAEDAGRFRLVWDGFVNGAHVERTKTQQEGQSREDRRSETRIKRALQAVSEATGAEPIGIEVDRRPRTLKGSGEVMLDQPDFARLVRYIGQTPWLVDVVEHITELEDWLEACPQKEG